MIDSQGNMNNSIHNLSRHEWEQRFITRIRNYFPVAVINGDIIAAELESWPVDDPSGLSDWLGSYPEDAADESLEAWLYD